MEIDAASRWYAFSVRPQKEAAASEVLRRHGFVAYVPMRERLVLVNRHRKTRERRRFPIVPGVVFAGRDHEIDAEILWRVLGRQRDGPSEALRGAHKPDSMSRQEWGRIIETRTSEPLRPVTALISIGGQCEIPAYQIKRMVKANGDDEREVMRVRVEKRFHEGELVRVMDGSPWHGFVAPVEEIRGQRARLMLHLFGRETPADISLDLLEAAE